MNEINFDNDEWNVDFFGKDDNQDEILTSLMKLSDIQSQSIHSEKV